ncbi:MAG: hypothetical protein ABSE51_07555 [Terracidiphilus sp.]
MVKNRVPLFGFRVDFAQLRAQRLAIQIGSTKAPEFAHSQSSDKAVASVPLKGFGMDLHEGRSLLAVQ